MMSGLGLHELYYKDYMSLIEAYVDGASRAQGTRDDTGTVRRGEAACGITIYRNRKLIGSFARGLGKRSNNEAEYEAVLNCIMMCWAADLADPIIYSDSLLVVKHINGDWDCNVAELLPYLLTIQDISEVFRFRVRHVLRSDAGIKHADWLANEFLDALAVRLGDAPRKRRKRKRKTDDGQETTIETKEES